MNKQKRTGFSLIELMVTVTIMLLMVGGGIAAYLNFNDRQVLISDAKNLETFLRSAQKKARVGDVPAGCDRLLGYSVNMASGQSSALMKAQCTNGDVNVSSLDFSTNTSLDSDFDISFKVLHGGAEFNSGNGEIILLSTDKKYTLKVTAGGGIEQGSVENLN